MTPPAGPSPAPGAAYPSTPGYAAPYAYAYGPPTWQLEWSKQVDRTKTGLLLLLVGSLLSWAPVVGFIGSLLIFIGAILIILGRKAFGRSHARNVILSIVLFVLGILVAIVGAFIAILAAFSPVILSGTEAEIAAALRGGFTNAVIVAAAGSLVSGLAGVFFTYALQKVEGRILLWAAYGATVALGVVTLILLLPAVTVLADELAREIITQGSADPTRIAAAFSGAGTNLTLLNVIPSLLFAGAAYLAWSRVNRREIPAAPAPAPAWAPPTPGTPPPTPPSPPTPPANP